MFDFGQNWLDYSRNALTPERLEQSRQDFAVLIQGIPLSGSSFLDIGMGQGLGVLNARNLGARVVGNDINPKCAEALAENARRVSEKGTDDISVVVGSILDQSVLEELRVLGQDGFDVVHSWGVLHHTGQMRQAMDNAASLVRRGGHFVVALYNRHWSSRPWLWIKRLYNISPELGQKLLVWTLYPVIAAAKFLVTGRNPFAKDRGMDFFHDVVDWVGGYPYEYASLDEVVAFLGTRGFRLVRATPAEVPTGCNQFVFIRE